MITGERLKGRGREGKTIKASFVIIANQSQLPFSCSVEQVLELPPKVLGSVHTKNPFEPSQYVHMHIHKTESIKLLII